MDLLALPRRSARDSIGATPLSSLELGYFCIWQSETVRSLSESQELIQAQVPFLCGMHTPLIQFPATGTANKYSASLPTSCPIVRCSRAHAA